MARKNGRWAHPARRHFPRPEGHRPSCLLLTQCATHPSILGKTNTHNHRNLETRKPGQKVPELLGMEKLRCARKGKGS